MKVKEDTHINFPVPTMFELFPKRSTTPVNQRSYGTGVQITRFDRNQMEANKALQSELKERAIAMGFQKGAVVAPRFSHPNMAMIPANWGIVYHMNSYHHDHSKYRPICVHWVVTGKQSSEHNPEDLYLIHEAPDEATLMLALQFQDMELRGGDIEC